MKRKSPGQRKKDRAAYQAAYRKTRRGKAVRKQYQQSPKGKATNKRARIKYDAKQVTPQRQANRPTSYIDASGTIRPLIRPDGTYLEDEPIGPAGPEK